MIPPECLSGCPATSPSLRHLWRSTTALTNGFAQAHDVCDVEETLGLQPWLLGWRPYPQVRWLDHQTHPNIPNHLRIGGRPARRPGDIGPKADPQDLPKGFQSSSFGLEVLVIKYIHQRSSKRYSCDEPCGFSSKISVDVLLWAALKQAAQEHVTAETSTAPNGTGPRALHRRSCSCRSLII